MGDEVDKIYVKLKQYEAEIKTSNQKLEASRSSTTIWLVSASTSAELTYFSFSCSRSC